jgi:hypothetical protein
LPIWMKMDLMEEDPEMEEMAIETAETTITVDTLGELS